MFGHFSFNRQCNFFNFCLLLTYSLKYKYKFINNFCHNQLFYNKTLKFFIIFIYNSIFQFIKNKNKDQCLHTTSKNNNNGIETKIDISSKSLNPPQFKITSKLLILML